MSGHTGMFVSITELSNRIKKTFIGAKVITVVINSNYIKETKRYSNHYTSPIGYIIDKRLYTLEQLSKHCQEEMKCYMLSIKNNWYVMIKSNPQHSVWAISCDTSNVKTFRDHQYYPTRVTYITQSKIINKLMTVEEFDVDVDFDDEDIEEAMRSRELCELDVVDESADEA